MTKELVERFLQYVKWDTQSSEETEGTPSTPGQMAFLRFLKEELKEIGLKEIELDENGYLFATLPSNTPREVPTIGFIAHVDTSPDCSGKDVNPSIVSHYDGKDIPLAGGETLSVERFPELKEHIGEDLIVTDGTTLLGADDKAGVAEIIQAMAYLQAHPEIEHGKIRVGFNPDEEIGMGASAFNVERFGCEWAYTMDGGDIGELEYENFNAATAKIFFKGLSVHPGYAKGKMRNATKLAVDFADAMPKNETPETTDGYEGFFHLIGISGSVEKSSLQYIIRDHDKRTFEQRKYLLKQRVDALNESFGEEVAVLEMHDQYYNMLEKIEPVMHVIDIALKAMEESGVKPKVQPIRGGTDGAQLSYKGLPCPNIFAGGINFHGPYEFVPIQSMEKAMMVIVKIAEITSHFNE